ncbi:hypothetical protein [Methylomonas koyamae]|uniref:Uncharacterized protein n=1 Tax=Methylomonas koyamae TaxID=702114 RepID=A0A291IK11_9GAMM|nr:hypothetical protein [Methylomonas koyamae]ATG90521.1 hypothetical protein MKLM6_2298 [Methylomonas koyamae]OAI22727.1 hypothetical protein A1356_18970 [Methylomonas koyamae]
MADYLPVLIAHITERQDPDSGEVRISAVCKTVQPETFNLNLSKLDAARLQTFTQGRGQIMMVPIRRGEINGRAFTSVADGFIFPAHGLEATFTLKDTLSKPSPAPSQSADPNPSPDPISSGKSSSQGKPA